ncbi:MAG: hypothetical protein J5532_03360, partial [Lachnospiraceae bacterium]|nr:hypothetical protein [Lachnospiraceae bacterium]
FNECRDRENAPAFSRCAFIIVKCSRCKPCLQAAVLLCANVAAFNECRDRENASAFSRCAFIGREKTAAASLLASSCLIYALKSRHSTNAATEKTRQHFRSARSSGGKMQLLQACMRAVFLCALQCGIAQANEKWYNNR